MGHNYIVIVIYSIRIGTWIGPSRIYSIYSGWIGLTDFMLHLVTLQAFLLFVTQEFDTQST